MGTKTPAPDGLYEAGRAVWAALTSAYELSPSELLLLAELAHTVDELATLREASADADPVVTGSTGQPRVHPLFAELRAHRQALSRLVDQLALPAEYENEGLSPRQQSAKKAADTRWSMERQRWGKGGKTSSA